MYDLAVWMDDDAAMSVAAASSSGLESLNKFLKQKKRANTSGGFAVGKNKTLCDKDVKALRSLHAMCLSKLVQWLRVANSQHVKSEQLNVDDAS